MFSACPCGAAERELEEAPPPSSVEEIKTPLQRIFFPEAYRDPLFPWLRQQLQKLPPFFADTQLDARFRTYYLRKDRTIDVLSEGWAIGGSLYYRSGWLKDVFSVEAEGFTSQPLFAPDNRGGTGLLAPGQEGYSVLGVANAKLRYKGVVLTGYRQYLDLPFVNRNDSRMTPQTFEAVTLAKSEGEVRFSTGYVWRIKRVNADEFVDMGEAIGLSENRGLAYGNVLWQPSEEFHIGTSFGIVPDVVAGVYTESAYEFALQSGWSVRLDGQLEYQWSVGDELLPGDSIETWNLGLRASTGWEGIVMRLGFSITDDDSPILSPYGSNPSYVDLMQRTFNQAGEKAVLLSLSYDFSHVGINGLSTILNYVEGWDGRVLGVRQDAREVDLTIDYASRRSSASTRGSGCGSGPPGSMQEGADQNGTDFRVILRYDFPVL